MHIRLAGAFLCFASLLCARAVPVLAQQSQLPYVGSGIDVDIYGNVYVLNAEKNIIVMTDKRGRPLQELGAAGWGNEQFDHPMGIWARNGINVYVADYGNHRVQRFDRHLSYVSTFATRDEDAPYTRFGFPTDVALSRLGDLFICDAENIRILKVNRFDQVETFFGGFGGGKGRLQNPTQLEIGPFDHLYVLDEDRIVVFDAFGNYLKQLGKGLFSAPGGLFADERGVVVLQSDTLFFFDSTERLFLRWPVAESVSFLGEEIRAVTFGGGRLHVLASDGVYIVDDPRVAELDKEDKSP